MNQTELNQLLQATGGIGNNLNFHVMPPIHLSFVEYTQAGGLCDTPLCSHMKGHTGLHRLTAGIERQYVFPWPKTLNEAIKMRLNNQMTAEEYETFILEETNEHITRKIETA